MTVEGRVGLPPEGVKEPEVQYPGFIDRIPNPITELRPFDPRPECFVFLDGGPAGDDATKPGAKAVVWELGSESFSPPLMPVLAGVAVDIKNVGRNTHQLYAVDDEGFLGKDPIGPGGVRQVKLPGAGKVVVVRSTESVHLEGRLVAVPTRYFARLGRDGSFKIEGVPQGKWTVRVWYRDGWLPLTQTVEVGSKSAKVELTLPKTLEPKKGGDKGENK